MQSTTYLGLTFVAPDPLPTYSAYDGQAPSPDTASIVPGWIAQAESSLGRKLTSDEKLELGKRALALYGYTSDASVTLTPSDVTIAASGKTITGGDYSWLDEVHANAEVISQDRIDEAVAAGKSVVNTVVEAPAAVAKWAGGVLAAPFAGFADGIFTPKTLIVVAGGAGIILTGMYLAGRLTPGAVARRAVTRRR